MKRDENKSDDGPEPATFDIEKLTASRIEALSMEVELLSSGDRIQATRSILEKALPLAARQIVEAALYSSSENTRVNASRYLLDKFLPREELTPGSAGTALDRLLNAVVTKLDTKEELVGDTEYLPPGR